VEIKTLQQFNQDYLSKRAFTENAAESAASPNVSVDVRDTPDRSAKNKNQVLLERIRRAPPILKDLLFLLLKISSIVLIFILLFTFLFGIIRYQEPSMNPAIKDGDLVLFYRYTKVGYLPGDAIVLDINSQRQVRRVVAIEGDTVDITEDGLIINGALQQETDIYQKTERYEEGTSFPLTVPEGHVFVLGDSRIGATDSRVYGCVSIKETLGKVMTVIRRRSI